MSRPGRHVATPATAQSPAAPASPRVPAGERIYAIGDIHGRLDLFTALIARIRDDQAMRPPATVRIVLLGDIIDRGPASAALVDHGMRLTRHSNRVVILKGNHEAMMVHALRGSFPALALWLRNGGDAALRSWGVADPLLAGGASPALLAAARAAVPEATIAWLEARPLSFAARDYLFVHAGIRPGVAIDAQSAEDLLWIRHEFLDSADDHGRMIVHGHSIVTDGVAMHANRIGIDTGAYCTDILSALALEDDRRWTLATGPNLS